MKTVAKKTSSKPTRTKVVKATISKKPPKRTGKPGSLASNRSGFAPKKLAVALKPKSQPGKSLATSTKKKLVSWVKTSPSKNKVPAKAIRVRKQVPMTKAKEKLTPKPTTKKTASPAKGQVIKKKPARVESVAKNKPVIKHQQIRPISYPQEPNPSPVVAVEEAYMNPKQLEHFKEILIRWRAQIMVEVDNTKKHLQEEGVNYPDPVDRANHEEEFSLELRTRDRERKLIRKIDDTLNRINDGDYGYCDICGAEIGLKRLEARPTATQCIECKKIAEIKEKQSGEVEF